MFSAAAMMKLEIIILAKHIDVVTRALGQLGVMHLLNTITDKNVKEISPDNISDQIRKFEELERKLNSLIQRLGIKVDKIPKIDETVEIAHFENLLDQVNEEVIEAENKINNVRFELSRIESDILQFKHVSFIDIDIDKFIHLEYVNSFLGSLPEKSVSELREKLSDKAVVGTYKNDLGQNKVVLFFSKKNKWAVSDELKNFSFRKDEISEELKGIPSNELLRLKNEYDEAKKNLLIYEDQKAILKDKYKEFIIEGIFYITYCLDLLRARKNFGKTQSLYFISGWVPKKNLQKLEDEIKRVTDNTVVFNAYDPSDLPGFAEGTLRVPVMLTNRRLFKPFEKLITTFGTPEYKEIEPTLFVAISFVLMFGIMFGDVGQGLVLFLVGLFLNRSKNERIKKLADIGFILMSVSVASIIFGFLYGSFFGNEDILPHLWVKPLNNIALLFKIAIIFGIIVNSLGIILNIINKFRQRNFYEGILDRFGLIGFIFYWGAIGIGIKHLIFQYKETSTLEILLLIVLPLVILFFREPLFNIYKRKKKLIDEDVMTYIIESIIGMMETLMVFLANTVSFIRVGAFALSHAALCAVIFTIADMLGGSSAGNLLSVLIIVLGNIIIILLEGLVVFVQSLRLEYYEFFGKFFKGTGEAFRPFKLTFDKTEVGGE